MSTVQPPPYEIDLEKARKDLERAKASGEHGGNEDQAIAALVCSCTRLPPTPRTVTTSDGCGGVKSSIRRPPRRSTATGLKPPGPTLENCANTGLTISFRMAIHARFWATVSWEPGGL